jgi:uncharacterized protein (TIGR02145 family)
MKKLLFLIAISCSLQVTAQDYLINFAAAGDAKFVSTVIVENLTKGTSLILNGGDILHLKEDITTGIFETKQIPGIRIYPNPMIENSTLEVVPKVPGEATVSIFDMSGRQIAQILTYLDNSAQEFRVSGSKKGMFIVNVKGSSYQFSGKLICNGNSLGDLSIEKISSNQTYAVKELKGSSKGYMETQGITDMIYSPGERLKFTALTGDLKTIETDIPDKTKTITFDLISVVDNDSNDYPVVEIGDQSWMAENLKTTKYRDGTFIPLVSGSTEWSNLTSPSYSWYSNSEETFKDPYGAIYNGYTIGTGKLCPTGWHVPTVDEWNSMKDYLLINNFSYPGQPGATAKSVASKTGWVIPQADPYNGNNNPVPEGVVGKDQQYNNSSGFNGFPAGMRNPSGSFSGIGYTGIWYSASGTTTLTDFSIYNANTDIRQGDDYRSAGFSVRCIKGETIVLPNLITSPAYNTTQTTATSGATIVGEGVAPVTSRGVCWNTTGNNYPTIQDSRTLDGSGTSSFTSSVTGLLPGTVYYMRSYAINSDGIAYGTLEVFTTKIADADGNIYNTILLNDNIWMVENLKTTRFSDGAVIPLVTESTVWSALSAPGFCYYNNDELTNKALYGGLYNWHAVNSEKICPINWHVASDNEWIAFTNFMAGEVVAGGRLKEAGTAHWLSPNSGATNDKGFTALPGGSRDSNGTFSNIGRDGNWWSSTQYDITNAWYRNMNYNVNSIDRRSLNKSNGLSVRCIKKIN